MKIEWNKVTWYSKLLAVIVFVSVFYLGLFLGFRLGNVAAELQFIKTRSAAVLEHVPMATATYSCNFGKSITASYFNGGSLPTPASGQPPMPTNTVSLKLSDGRTMTLPQTISADGTRYANPDETFVFWSKGNDAFITEGKSGTMTFKNCLAKQ